MGLSILTRRRIDGAVAVVYRILKPKNLQRYPVTVFWHKGSNGRV